MTLKEFIMHLVDIDIRLGYEECNVFNCGVRKIYENYFEYDFNAEVLCEVKFFADGSVVEKIEGGEGMNYESVDAWKNKILAEF